MDKRVGRWVKLLSFVATLSITVLVLLVTLPEIVGGVLQRHPNARAFVRNCVQATWEFRSRLRTKVISGRTDRVLDDYMKRHAVRKLQLGAGTNNLPGWLNTDIEPQPGQLFLDAAKPFPIPDGSFHYVTSEHVFEHLGYEEGLVMLKECYRILQPGGKLRIATPNLLKFVGLFRKDRDDDARRYIQQKLRWHGWPEVEAPECMIPNLQLSSFGHQFLYDPETLRASLAVVGFKQMREFAPGESDDPVLRGIEFRHGGALREANAFETMVFEAVRP